MLLLGAGLLVFILMILGNVARLGLVTVRLSAVWREARDTNLAVAQRRPAPSQGRPAALSVRGAAGRPGAG